MPIIFLSSALLILPCCRGERGGARGSRKEEGLSNRPSNRPRKGGEGIEWSGSGSVRRKINSLGDHRADDGHHPATAPLRWARLGKFCPSLKVSGGGRGTERASEGPRSAAGEQSNQYQVHISFPKESLLQKGPSRPTVSGTRGASSSSTD